MATKTTKPAADKTTKKNVQPKTKKVAAKKSATTKKAKVEKEVKPKSAKKAAATKVAGKTTKPKAPKKFSDLWASQAIIRFGANNPEVKTVTPTKDGGAEIHAIVSGTIIKYTTDKKGKVTDWEPIPAVATNAAKAETPAADAPTIEQMLGWISEGTLIDNKSQKPLTKVALKYWDNDPTKPYYACQTSEGMRRMWFPADVFKRATLKVQEA